MVPLLAPSWTLVVFLSVGAAACVVWSLQLRFCSYHQSRWIVAALLGAGVASTLAPSPWLGAFLCGVALAIPVSLLAFKTQWTISLADPVAGSSTLIMLAVWTAALGVTVAALREVGPGWSVAVLLGLATYNNAVGAVQVYRGISGWVWRDEAFGPRGEVGRVPTAFLHNTWKPAAINAMVLPVAIALVLHDSPWLMGAGLLVFAGAVWQLVMAGGLTCSAAAFAGMLAMFIAARLPVLAVVSVPLALVCYPLVRQQLLDDPRWEAWQVAWRLIRRNRGIGLGVGGWMGLRVQTPKEGERIWMWLHNDWLETLLECGPLPVLCALGYLGTAVARAAGGVSPLEAGLFGSLVSLAVLSLGYMPWRTWPVNLFALGTIACWEALQGR